MRWPVKKQICFILIGVCLPAFAACNKGRVLPNTNPQFHIRNDSSMQLGENESETLTLDSGEWVYLPAMAQTGVLRIAALNTDAKSGSANLLTEVKRLFEEKYKGWQVFVEKEAGDWTAEEKTYAYTPGETLTITTYRDAAAEMRFYEKLPEKLRDEDGPDLILMHGANRNRLLAEGLLEDLLPLMAYDIEMPLDTILPGILQAMDYKRGVYIVPAYFYTTSLKIYVSDQTLLRFARELPQPFDWDGFMTFFIPEKERLKLFCVLPVPLGTLTGMLTDEYYPYFYDYETNEYRFDNYVFREILHTVKTLYTLGMVLDDDSSDTFLYGAEGGMLLPSPVSIKDISDYGQFIMRGIDGYFPMPTIRGAEGMAVSMGMEFAVSVNAQNKTAAWEFIKILLSEEIQNSVYLYDFQPVAATLNTQAVNRARGKPPNYDLSNEEWDRYNRERRAFFAGIDRVKGGNGAPDVTDIILKYAIRFYRDEAELDNIIADLQQEADARLGAVFE